MQCQWCPAYNAAHRVGILPQGGLEHFLLQARQPGTCCQTLRDPWLSEDTGARRHEQEGGLPPPSENVFVH